MALPGICLPICSSSCAFWGPEAPSAFPGSHAPVVGNPASCACLARPLPCIGDRGAPLLARAAGPAICSASFCIFRGGPAEEPFDSICWMPFPLLFLWLDCCYWLFSPCLRSRFRGLGLAGRAWL